MDNIDKVIKNIIKLLEKNGIFISESHYFLSLVKTLQYDTIYHEHLRYYTISSLKNIFKKYDLKIIKVKKIPTHGGSIRVYVTRKSFKFKNCPSVNLAIKEEKNYLSANKIKEFRDKVLFSKVNLLSKLQNLKEKNKKIFGVGAPSRAATLVNFVGLNEDIIDCICEIKGSYKINHFLPGTRIPIYQEDIIYKKKPDYLLLLSWHISKELIINFRKVVNKFGKIIKN
jgi:hypothetical protein